MASNALVFFAGVGTTFVFLTAGFGSGLVFTRAAFDDKPISPRSDSKMPPPVRVILPAYGEQMPAPTSVPDQPYTDAVPASAPPEPGREAQAPSAKISVPDKRKEERNLRAERRRQAEHKARRVARARARQEMIKLPSREEPGIMAFGGGGHFFGN